MAEVFKTDIDRMVASAGGSPRAVLLDGDLVGGHWPQNPAALKTLFGTVSTTLAQDLEAARPSITRGTASYGAYPASTRL